jgi:anti-anti-sigma factor
VELILSSYGSLERALLDRIKNVLFNVAESGMADVIVDLSNVHYFGAKFVGVLATARKILRDRRRRLLLCGVTPFCQRLLNVLNLQELFEIYPTQATAISHVIQIPPKGSCYDERPLRFGLVTHDLRWDPRYLCLNYLGDGDPLYFEIIPRD